MLQAVFLLFSSVSFSSMRLFILMHLSRHCQTPGTLSVPPPPEWLDNMSVIRLDSLTGVVVMKPVLVSVVAVLAVLATEVQNEDVRRPCAHIQTSSSVVPLGSRVAATCVISHACLQAWGPAVRIEWRLGGRLLPSGPGANGSGRVSEVVIPRFNQSSAFLTCSVGTSPAKVVGGVEIRAGYGPETPQNLSCQTNLTVPETLTCSWDAGQRSSLLPTQYSLHTEIWDSNENITYRIPTGAQRFTIPRSGFVLFSEIKIYVTAVNELGEATSRPVVMEPISAAKFDPPKILKVEAVPKRSGCLRLSWSLSQHQAWILNYRLSLEVRLKTAESHQWKEQPILVSRVKPTRPFDQCRLLPGTRYTAQIRVRYQQSPWSEWSGSQCGVTLESAPTGRLDWWMKLSGDPTHQQLNAHLFWKPSKQFRPNSQNVSYIVSVQKPPGGKVCATMGSYCTFQLPGKAKRVYVSAVNAAGRSPPTEVRIDKPKALTAISAMSAVPQDARSFLVQWRNTDVSGLTGYVVEWTPLLPKDISLTRFELADRNQSSLLITGSFEPYKPYGISVYPRFKDGTGLPETVNAYSRQKAPSMVPKIQMKKMWHSNIELTWDVIPLEHRNGIIQNYKVFYWDQNGHVNVVTVEPQERRVILKGLNAMSVYEAFMMVSTDGWSLNGSRIHFEVEPFDAMTVVMILTASGVGLSLLVIFIVMSCFSNNRRLKGHIWPIVPDPANSSIKSWTSGTSQHMHPAWDNDEPNPVYLSHLSFLDLPMKVDKQEDDHWLSSAEDTSDLGESICGSPFIPGYSGSTSDSVPYATVIFTDPCSSPSSTEPRVYLRSESTQPLLETEESFSPKCYQNMATDGKPKEQCFFGPGNDCGLENVLDPLTIWDDFPFLRALAMNDDESK